MARSTSPLRYPGGKAALYPKMADMIRLNGFARGHYAEPYAGGCGLALELLFNGHVSHIHLNDFDPDIWMFWYSVLERTDEFIKLVEETPLTIEEWHRQKQIMLEAKETDAVIRGFAAFYMNRTNRSGIIRGAGVIGGQAQQGNYLMDCRFNRADLVRRIRRVAAYRDQISFTGVDALQFLDMLESELGTDVFCCIDPPYYNKGSSLYTSFYNPEDHASVAERVLRLKCPWVITYDDTPEIRNLYSAQRQFELSLTYSVEKKRTGQEVFVISKGLSVPGDIEAREMKPILGRPSIPAQ